MEKGWGEKFKNEGGDSVPLYSASHKEVFGWTDECEAEFFACGCKESEQDKHGNCSNCGGLIRKNE